MDLVEFDEHDQSIQLWHCGVGSRELADGEQVWLAPHCNPSFVPDRGMVEMAPVLGMVYKPGKATVVRITHEGENICLLDGEFVTSDKPSYDGSRGWLSNLRLNRVPIEVRDLVNTLMVQQIQHHYAVGLGDYSKELLEIAGWLGISPIKKVSYEDYLQYNG